MILGPAKLSLVQECVQASDEPKAHTDRQLRAVAGRPWPQQQSGASVRAVADVTESDSVGNRAVNLPTHVHRAGAHRNDVGRVPRTGRPELFANGMNSAGIGMDVWTKTIFIRCEIRFALGMYLPFFLE